MNCVLLEGRLTKDVECRYTRTGKPVSSFTIAVNRGSKDVNGKEEVDFVSVVAWDALAELAGNTLGKGSKVFLQGKLQFRSYMTADQQKRWVTEVVANYIMSKPEAEKRVDAAKVFGGGITEEIPF